MSQRSRRPLDAIDRDMIEAERLGYGVHYGWYKADHPQTKETYQLEETRTHRRRAPGKLYTITCEICGKEFQSENSRKKTCSPKCRSQISSMKTRLRHKQNKLQYEEAVCRGCGVKFTKRSKTQMFCTQRCCWQYHYTEKKRKGL